MASSALAPSLTPEPLEIPVTPSAERWRAMSVREREVFLALSLAALQREVELSPEGLPHSMARASALNVLGEFFSRLGRRIFLAADLPVHYPDERAFAPDLLAVCDVEAPGYDDPRMAWVVADEGRGLDLALEIIYAGDRDKDLVTNVARYARLQIPEYFVYDRRNQRLYGYRLPQAGGRSYESVPSRGGRLPSRVLGLDLGVADGRLRFFSGDAMVPEARELIGRLEGLVSERERSLDAEIAARRAAEARAEAEAAARKEAVAGREAAERSKEAAERSKEAAEARAEAEATARAALEARLAALLAERDGR